MRPVDRELRSSFDVTGRYYDSVRTVIMNPSTLAGVIFSPINSLVRLWVGRNARDGIPPTTGRF